MTIRFLCCFLLLAGTALSQVSRPWDSEEKWGAAIAGFEKKDRQQAPAKDSILFVGSSSIRMWKLEESWPDRSTINRGFGGSTIADSIHFFDRIIAPYKPKAIVVYAGDNDISKGLSVDQVVEDYETLIGLVDKKLPGTPVIYVAIKPSLSRWNMWPTMKAANDKIAEFCAKNDHLFFADIAKPMLANAKGTPRPDWFAGDGLHLNGAGYKGWKAVVDRQIRLALNEPTQPNVIVILTDDQGWGDVSLNGNKNLNTPNIDSLAREGASFERFYVCPVCSPTRAEFLTGRYHPRGGVYSTSAGGERLDLDERTIADIFQQADYATGAFGKWHNGMQYPYHPNGRGFDAFYGFCSGHWGDYFSPMLEHNGEVVQGEGFVIDDFTDQAMKFIESSGDQPFFVYLPYNTPHSPMQVPDEYWERFKDKELTMHHFSNKENDLHLRAALAMCENIDWNVGRILKKLDQLGIAEDTIIAYFHDNGPNGVRWNGGFKGRKGSTDEGGVRSPLLLRWKGTIPAGKVVPQMGAAIDLLPTLTDLAGVTTPTDRPLDGMSLKPVILGEPKDWGDRIVFTHWKTRISLRTERFCLDEKGNLFDLSKDPGQKNDVAGEFPDLAATLRNAAELWRKDLLPGLEDDTRPFVIGHPGSAITHVPARDGIAHGGIKRSNRFPNDSFFQNWTSTDGKITWTAEVGATADYEVELHYTCPAGSTGSTLELSFNESTLTGNVSEAHDSPLLGAKDDRSPRMESYTKDWHRMKLGTIRLEKGKGELTLRALKVPKGEVMDFRLMVLRRVADVDVALVH
tara:strand:+ start:4617 stop:7007 length:2391 start_codon:yes stop_codon:yes gene_type:complete